MKSGLHEGDSITWNFVVDEPHTLTFLTAEQVRSGTQGGMSGILIEPGEFRWDHLCDHASFGEGSDLHVNFATFGNFKLVCLVHPDMTGVVHVLDFSKPLPHTQDFYDAAARDAQSELLSDTDLNQAHVHEGEHEAAENHVTTGMGSVSANPGGSRTFSVMRFLKPTRVIHAGETVEAIPTLSPRTRSPLGRSLQIPSRRLGM